MDGLNMHYTTTLNMIFSVTYYLESRNAISMYYIYFILSTNAKSIVKTLQKNNIFTWPKITSIKNKYSIMYLQIVSDTKYDSMFVKLLFHMNVQG